MDAIVISSALRQQRAVSDQLFDRLFPSSQRSRSTVHWTPIDVAIRVCKLLAPARNARVLDIGAGVGKLCLVGALTTGSSWFGIERDAKMVHAAVAAAQRLGVGERTSFKIGDVSTVDWSTFDAFYLFNPFAEGLFSGHRDAMTRRETYIDNIEVVERGLAAARPGTRVVTYHGFRGDCELDGYDLVRRESARHDELCLWIRRARCVSKQALNHGDIPVKTLGTEFDVLVETMPKASKTFSPKRVVPVVGGHGDRGDRRRSWDWLGECPERPCHFPPPPSGSNC